MNMENHNIDPLQEELDKSIAKLKISRSNAISKSKSVEMQKDVEQVFKNLLALEVAEYLQEQNNKKE